MSLHVYFKFLSFCLSTFFILIGSTAVAQSVAINTVDGAPFCVTTASGTVVTIGFTATGSFNSGNAFTVELSDASGDFTSPLSSVIIADNAAGFYTIDLAIPAGTPSGSGYQVQVISSNPAFTSSPSSAFTVTLPPISISISPTTAQSINVSTDGTALTVDEIGEMPTSRQWKYAIATGGPYNDVAGEISTSYTPNFATIGTYYVICESTFGPSASPCAVVSSNEVSISTVATGLTITSPTIGTSYCVTTASSTSISVDFDAEGNFTGNTFTVKLSDASGSFSTPISTATLNSNVAGTHTVNLPIPAGTSSSSGYKVQVTNNYPALTTSSSAFDITLSPSSISISPSTDQNINTSTNGTTLIVDDGGATATDWQWKYAISAGGPYMDITGAKNSTYTPNFTTANNYYVVCQSTFGTCVTLISNEVKVVVTGPSISTGTIIGSPFCAGDAVSVPFTAVGNYSSNAFKAQLSNAAGSFASPTIIGSKNSNVSGTIMATLPTGISGTGYRIRVVSTNPALNGSDNSFDITIRVATVSLAPATLITNVNNTNTNIGSITFTESYPATSRQWLYSTNSAGPFTQVASGQTVGNNFFPQFSSTGIYYLVCASTFGAPCNATITSAKVTVTVVQPTITTSTPASNATYCVTSSSASSNISVAFTKTGVYETGNVFTVQLSNATGTSYRTTLATTATSPVNVTIPAGTPAGSGYKIRVVNLFDPLVTGTSSSGTITINSASVSIATTPPFPSAAPQTTYLNGLISQLTVTESATPGTVSSRIWQISTDGTLFTDINGQAGNTYTPSSGTAGTKYYRCKTTFSGACSSPVISNVIQVTVNALTTTTFRSKQNGLWSTLGTWEKWNGSAWSTVLVAPDATSTVYIQNTVTLGTNLTHTGSITVTSTGILSLAADLNVTKLTVNSSGRVVEAGNGPSYTIASFTNSTPNRTLTTANNAGSSFTDPALSIYGILEVSTLDLGFKSYSTIQGTGTYPYGGTAYVKKVFVSETQSKLQINGLLIVGPNATWDTGNNGVNIQTAGSGSFSNQGTELSPNYDPSTTLNYCMATNGCTALPPDNYNPDDCVEVCLTVMSSPYPFAYDPLPINLVDFSAKFDEENQRIKLDWTTDSEKNNEYFTIERSSNNRAFHEVQRVSGAGNSQERLAYVAYDENPLPGLTYYRLRQTDFDGTSTYSKIAAVENKETKTAVFSFSVAPNPFDGQYTSLILNRENASEIQVMVYSSLGQLVFENHYATGNQSLKLQLPNALPAGVYWIKAYQEGQVSCQKVLVGNR